MTARTWESKVAAKQQACFEKIPKEWKLLASVTDALQSPVDQRPNHVLEMNIPRTSGIMSDQELHITEDYTVEELLKALREGSLSALDVTVAFSKRAAIAQQLLFCLTETYFPEAQERARFLDSEREQGRIVGPLHGLPISLKDGFQIRGSEATIGFVSFLGRISEHDSPLVEILNELGAVVYVKTNIPQTLMTADSHNNIFGRTLNPHKTCLSAGGSSGGEGALVAFRGSPLGVGTDIASSIRIPALCCGTYGFKPTTSRIPYGGQVSGSRPGISFFLASAGPLANDVEALGILSRAVISARPALYDSTALDNPWRDLARPQTTPRLKLGLVGEDPAFPLHPPIRRALAEAVQMLQSQGHEIVSIPATRTRIADATSVAWAYFYLDETAFTHITASGEPIVPSIKEIDRAFGTLSNDFCNDLKDLEGLPKVAALNMKRRELADQWRAIWNEGKFDGVIGPANQGTAPKHDLYGLPPYTVLLNVLDYPACVIPFGRASSELDPDPLFMGPGQVGPDCKFEYFRSSVIRRRLIRNHEDQPELVAGAPTSIQVFTNKMRDEECLQVAAIVDQCLRAA